MSKVYIGTSGWVYKSWEATFYPKTSKATGRLGFYATQFPTVEINATFYRLPSLKMVKGWRVGVPQECIFAVKGSRFITHMKKLAKLDGGLNKFIRRIQPLQPHLGPILWQLPPILQRSPSRLGKFLRQLPKSLSHAVEFRHPSWYTDDVFELLRKYQVAHVPVSSLGMPMNLAVTADFIYIRFHGLENGAAHDYSRAELRPWARHIRKQAQAGRTVYVYFNNDANVRAPANAQLLMEMVGANVVKPATAPSG
ncbi:MAG: DUF72 domain-containing protein [Verrucomicrobiota bacterium]